MTGNSIDKMTVVMSKYVDLVMDKFERNSSARMVVSHALVGAAVTAWSLKALYTCLSETRQHPPKENGLTSAVTKNNSDQISEEVQ